MATSHDRFQPAGPGFHEYTIEETAFGTWRRFVHPGGSAYAEFRSHAEILGFPFVHVTRGVCPETGRRKTAAGFIAIGRKAAGFIAIGQLATGVIAVGQACLGLVAAGQAAAGIVSLGQCAIGYQFGIGQIAVGRTAVGQIALGRMILAQTGVGDFVWTPGTVDPEAESYFRGLLQSILAVFRT